MEQSPPIKYIQARAPIRICDNGGWTDTWFAGEGRVLNMAVSPLVEVQISVFRRGSLPAPVVFQVENYNDEYPFHPGVDEWERHPLLEAAVTRLGIPDAYDCRIRLYSDAPGGGSMGTSAAVAVALVGALDLLTPGRMLPRQIAEHAHAVETEMLQQQSGIQDQLAAVYGGINFIKITRFPNAEVHRLGLPEELLHALEARLSLVYLGKAHSSSKVHEMVIQELENSGPAHPQIIALRQAAEAARESLLVGDLAAFGRSMTANTAQQKMLHADLVNAEARSIIEIAKTHGAAGWKVNGAGGEGGSLTLLSGPDMGAKRAMLAEILQEDENYSIIPIRLEQAGLRRWDEKAL